MGGIERRRCRWNYIVIEVIERAMDARQICIEMASDGIQGQIVQLANNAGDPNL
jgi:hypothetical protein